MFFGKSRRERIDLEQFLRKVAQLTNPDGVAESIQHRRECRLPRVFPIFLVPCDHEDLLWNEAALGLSHDISEHGMGAIVSRRFPHHHVVVGLWPTNELVTAATSRPGFIRGEVRNNTDMGGGYHRLGILFRGLVDDSHAEFSQLFEHAKSLLPADQLRLWKLAHPAPEPVSS